MRNEDREALIKFFAELQGGQRSKEVFSRRSTEELIDKIAMPLVKLLAEIGANVETDTPTDTEADHALTKDQTECLAILRFMAYVFDRSRSLKNVCQGLLEVFGTEISFDGVLIDYTT